MASEVAAVGTTDERKTFGDVYNHYYFAQQDLRRRIVDFDRRDILFRSHIVKQSWPYRALVFDPRIFTTLIEKGARILANKPRGRMTPRESGDALGAKINTELLDFQWDDNERVDGLPMLAKWHLMDLYARKYGASFGLVEWRWQRQVQADDLAAGKKPTGKALTYFDGPNFRPWNNRDVLANPSYSSVKLWIQLRDYVTFSELTESNNAARSKPIYKNLDLLRDVMTREGKKGGDMRSTNYVIKDKAISGLQDWLGHDEVFKTIEIVTEYRPDRWITVAPKHGIVLRDIPNPYKHGQIPVVMLKYYPIDDDLYGVSEIEPIEKLQNALNAYICQNLDTLNMSTYVPLKVRKGGGAVEMHTLQFGPGSKWMMNDPLTDVIPHNQGAAGVAEFVNVYRLIVSAIEEGLGETSGVVSNQLPGSSDKTATEIKDLAVSRSARDNFNQIFLSEAIKKQMMFWYKMNQQFLFSNPAEEQKVIQIVGRDAMKFFQNQGLDQEGLDDDAISMLSDPSVAGTSVQPQDLMKPLFPVKTAQGVTTKFSVEPGAQTGKLIIEKDDLAGDYDYVPDIGSMSSDASEQELKAKSDFLSLVSGIDPKTGQPSGIAAMMQQEGKKLKATEFVIDYAEDIGFKSADQYIEDANPNPQAQQVQQGMGMEGGMANGQVQQSNGGGAITPQGVSNGMANGGVGGIQNGVSSLLNGQAQPILS